MKDINEKNRSAVAEDMSNKVECVLTLASKKGWSYEDINTVAAKMVAGILSTNFSTQEYLDKAIDVFDGAVRDCYEQYIEFAAQKMWDLMEETYLLFSKTKHVFDEETLHRAAATLYNTLFDDEPLTMKYFVGCTTLIISQNIVSMHRDDKEAASETISKVIEEIRVNVSKYLKRKNPYENKE